MREERVVLEHEPDAPPVSGGTPASERPSSVTSPASRRCSPAITRNSVDLPLPLGPRTATVVPPATVEVDLGERGVAAERHPRADDV